MKSKSTHIRLVHFVGEGVFSSVLDSQVLVPLSLLGKHARHIDRSIVCLTSVRYRGRSSLQARIREIQAAVPDVAIHFEFRPFLGVPFQDRIWARHLKQSLAEWRFGADDRIIVHCRGQHAGAAAAIVKRHDQRVRVVVDLRGDPLDEVTQRGIVGRYRRWVCRTMLARALSGADGLNTVTQRLADVLTHGGFADRRRPDVVIGCCVDTKRFYFDPAIRAKQRRALGLDGKFVLCYCGGMAHWQRPDAIAEMMAAVLLHMPDAHMLAVSREADVLLGHLSRIGVGSEQVTARWAPHDEVASYLMAADVGLLLRENTPTNQVASPVKFAEYLRCGLPVILTPYIGELGDLVRSENVGKTITFPIRTEEAIESARTVRGWLEKDGDDYRRRCSRVAHEQLSWESKLPQLVELYERLSV